MEHYPDIQLKDTTYQPGNYQGRCSACHRSFIGHRLSTKCEECAEEWVVEYNSWSQEDRAAFWKKQTEAVEAFFRDDYPKLKLFKE